MCGRSVCMDLAMTPGLQIEQRVCVCMLDRLAVATNVSQKKIVG